MMRVCTSDNSVTCLSKKFVSSSQVLSNMGNVCTITDTLCVNISKKQIDIIEGILETQCCYVTNQEELFELINICDFFCIEHILPLFFFSLVKELHVNFLKMKNKDNMLENASIKE